MQPEDTTHRGNQLFLLFIANRVNRGGKLFIFHEEKISALAHEKPLIEIGLDRTGSVRIGSSQVGQSAIILLEQAPKFRILLETCQANDPLELTEPKHRF